MDKIEEYSSSFIQKNPNSINKINRVNALIREINAVFKKSKITAYQFINLSDLVKKSNVIIKYHKLIDNVSDKLKACPDVKQFNINTTSGKNCTFLQDENHS